MTDHNNDANNSTPSWGVISLDYSTAATVLGADLDTVYADDTSIYYFAISPTGTDGTVKMIQVLTTNGSVAAGDGTDVWNIGTGDFEYSKDIDVALIDSVAPVGSMGEVAEYGPMTSQSLPVFNFQGPMGAPYSIAGTGIVLEGEVTIFEANGQFVVAQVEPFGPASAGVIMGDSQDYIIITEEQKDTIVSQAGSAGAMSTKDVMVPDNIGFALAQPLDNTDGGGDDANAVNGLPVFEITETEAGQLNGMGDVWADPIVPGFYLYDNDNHDAHLVQVALVQGDTYEIVTDGNVYGMNPLVPQDAHGQIENYFLGLGGNDGQIDPIGFVPTIDPGTPGGGTPVTPPGNTPVDWNVFELTVDEGVAAFGQDVVNLAWRNPNNPDPSNTQAFAIYPGGNADEFKAVKLNKLDFYGDNPRTEYNLAVDGTGNIFETAITQTTLDSLGLGAPDATMAPVLEAGPTTVNTLATYAPSDPVTIGTKTIGGSFTILSAGDNFVVAQIEDFGPNGAVLMGESQNYILLTAEETTQLETELASIAIAKDVYVPNNLELALAALSAPVDGGGGGDGGDAGAGAAKHFEIESVDGGRYGNIITYGVKMTEDAGDQDFTSMTFNLSWDDVDGAPQYAFWGQFEVQGDAAGLSTVDAISDDTTAATFFTHDDDGISFAMIDVDGMSFGSDEYIATFMLEKTNSQTTNTFHLDTAQYTYLDADNPLDNQLPEMANYSDDPFEFSFADHSVALDLENARGKEIPNTELMVTNLATNDGLSVIPVTKMGNMVKYQLVMNIPIPVFIQEADINPDHRIEIDATIFDNSITWLNELTTISAQTDLLTTTLTKSVSLDGAEISVEDADTATYTGHEFFDLVSAATDADLGGLLSDMSTSGSLSFTLGGLTRPALADENGDAATDYKDAEGRYVLAEFVAIDTGEPLTFTASQGDEGNGGLTAAATREITRISSQDFDDVTNDQNEVIGSGAMIADGSEVVALADGFYANEYAYNDAVGAEDALGALRISKDTATDADGNNVYSQSEIIAADFDMDGQVTAADAYDILQYAVAGHELGKGTAKWVYIDDLNSNEATPDSVTFDPVIDLFVGSETSINATGVLIGDVTSSYTGFAGGLTTIQAGVNFVDQIVADGWTTGIIRTAEGATAGEYSVNATDGYDGIALGAADGVHVITDYNGDKDAVLLELDAYEISQNNDVISHNDISYSSAGAETAADKVAEALTVIADTMGTDNGSGGLYQAVHVHIGDTDNVEDPGNIWGFDTDADGQTDLTVQVFGGDDDDDDVYVLPNTADPEILTVE